MPTLTESTLLYLVPEIVLMLTATAIYVVGAFGAARQGWSWMAQCGIALAAYALYFQASIFDSGLTGPLVIDHLAFFIRWLALGTAALLVLLTARAARDEAGPETTGSVLLVMAGLLGLYIEFNQPGMIIPGVIGGLCLILAAIAFQILPFSWVGLMLMFLGMGLLVAEVFVTSYGFLFSGGVICFLLGGSMLFDLPEVSDLNVSFWSVLVPITAAFSLFAGIVVFAVGRSMGREQTVGVGELLGLVGRAQTALAPEGRVFIRGEYWSARADEEISAGEAVQVSAVEGMRLRVRRASQNH